MAALGACAPRDTDPSGAHAPGPRAARLHAPDVLATQLAGEPESLDPARCSENLCGELLHNLFAGLVQLGPDGRTPTADVAHAWHVDEGGTRWTFRLRPTRWSDGTQVTAHDFVYAWLRALRPATGARSASMLHVVRGAKAYAEGRLPAAEVGLWAPADDVLVVQLDGPVPYFLQLCAHTLLRPVPAHHLEALARRGADPQAWTQAAHLVSNGPYTLARRRFRRDLCLRRHLGYWAVADVQLRAVHVAIVPNAETTAQLYATGELDWTGASTPLPPSYAKAWRRRPDFRAEPALSTAYYWLNTARPPLDDVRVRRALSLAIDRTALVERVLQGAQVPSDRLVPPALTPGAEGASPAFDPAQARALLQAAGPRATARPLRLVYNSAESNRQVAEAIQAMWRTHLGVQVVLENQEWRVYLQRVAEGDFDVARMGWQGDYPDAQNFLDNVFAPGNNLSGWYDADFDAALARARRLPDGAARDQVLAAAQARMLAAAPLVPLYHGAQTSMVGAHVHGWRPNLLGVHPYKDLRLGQ